MTERFIYLVVYIYSCQSEILCDSGGWVSPFGWHFRDYWFPDVNLLIAKQKHLMRDMPKYFMCVWLLKQFGSLFLKLREAEEVIKWGLLSVPLRNIRPLRVFFYMGFLYWRYERLFCHFTLLESFFNSFWGKRFKEFTGEIEVKEFFSRKPFFLRAEKKYFSLLRAETFF